ncbi:Catecholate siderophore receptor Fiu [BD1-7 clade bacterium]|uniref:Catecholate siderophore receptor Fiu n=1 Tax=BD1-7 clade bacterium TaxID=2029982 RepID=A0A5S9PB18_9GAMM|nr:Catecholate siderophore receptor Fiu [BD1-7 clade bacterium]
MKNITKISVLPLLITGAFAPYTMAQPTATLAAENQSEEPAPAETEQATANKTPTALKNTDKGINRENYLETVIVTATREKQTLANTAASVGVIGTTTLEDTNPIHPAEVLNRIPGVGIVQLGSGSQGTAAAIRQPVSFGPVYLYLENGVPTRSAGFFNHNALYELNVATANGVEVLKGPGSALYGSDAIGAVVNILDGQPPEESSLVFGLEAGSFGWKRLQANGAWAGENNGFTLKADVGSSDGWRENTGTNKQSFTTSWFTTNGSDFRVNTVLSGTHLDYNTGGSGLLEADFKNDPKQAGNLIGYRDVDALRFSSAIEQDFGNGTLSITPFARKNDLEYIATWTLNSGRYVERKPWQPACLPRFSKDIENAAGDIVDGCLDSQDAHINESGHQSLGTLIKYQHTFDDSSLIIGGVDIDYTQGNQKQTHILRTDDSPGVYWQSYEEGDLLYDYNVNFLAISPYIHGEYQITQNLRMDAGLRFDTISYDYDNHLPFDPSDPGHQRPESQDVSFNHLSPKFGLIYDFTDSLNGYFAYRHAFRIPTAGQLFRAGPTADSTDLKPVKADSYELGLRGNITSRFAFETAIYYLEKRDDILTVLDTTTGLRRNVNAGSTEHYGIEIGGDLTVTEDFNIALAFTQTAHKYKAWTDRSGDFSGNNIPNAPENFGNLRFNYHPSFMNGGYFELEWVTQGKHYINEANDGDPATYDGYNLVNFRASYWVNDNINLYMRALNLTDELYAETTSKWGPQFTPGSPRAYYFGVKYGF